MLPGCYNAARDKGVGGGGGGGGGEGAGRGERTAQFSPCAW